MNKKIRKSSSVKKTIAQEKPESIKPAACCDGAEKASVVLAQVHRTGETIQTLGNTLPTAQQVADLFNGQAISVSGTSLLISLPKAYSEARKVIISAGETLTKTQAAAIPS